QLGQGRGGVGKVAQLWPEVGQPVAEARGGDVVPVGAHLEGKPARAGDAQQRFKGGEWHLFILVVEAAVARPPYQADIEGGGVGGECQGMVFGCKEIRAERLQGSETRI